MCHVSSVVCDRKCKCGENSIDETGRNVTQRCNEHSDRGKNSALGNHLNQFPEQRFNLKILRKVPNKVRQRKIHEACYVICLHPNLNSQLELTCLTLL